MTTMTIATMGGDVQDASPQQQRVQKATQTQQTRIKRFATDLSRRRDAAAGVATLEGQLGHPIADLDKDDADTWITRLEWQRDKQTGSDE